MRFRLRAFGLHASASATLLTLIFGALYFGWYRWPGWYLTGVLHVVAIAAFVDVALGPTLTLIVASPRKPRRELARDIGIIVAVQLVALIYAAITLWWGRPLYYTFSVDRLQIVQASDIDAGEVALALRQNPTLAPHWYDRPRWVWAPLPEDEEATKIVQSAVFGGHDVVEMPRYYRPWQQARTQLRQQLTALDDMNALSPTEKQNYRRLIARLGLASNQRNALLLWADVRRVPVIFEPDTLRIRAILEP